MLWRRGAALRVASSEVTLKHNTLLARTVLCAFINHAALRTTEAALGHMVDQRLERVTLNSWRALCQYSVRRRTEAD